MIDDLMHERPDWLQRPLCRSYLVVCLERIDLSVFGDPALPTAVFHWALGGRADGELEVLDGWFARSAEGVDWVGVRHAWWARGLERIGCPLTASGTWPDGGVAIAAMVGLRNTPADPPPLEQQAGHRDALQAPTPRAWRLASIARGAAARSTTRLSRLARQRGGFTCHDSARAALLSALHREARRFGASSAGASAINA